MPDEAQSWEELVRYKFHMTLEHFGPDGSNYEGVAYSEYGTIWILHYLEMLKGITGESLYNNPYMENHITYRLYIYPKVPLPREANKYSLFPVALLHNRLFHRSASNICGGISACTNTGQSVDSAKAKNAFRALEHEIRLLWKRAIEFPEKS